MSAETPNNDGAADNQNANVEEHAVTDFMDNAANKLLP